MLEVCVDSVESAVTAQRGGADRLELCANLVIGGTTPTPALYKKVRAKTTIPIHVLLRPRFGDFLYSKDEFEVLKGETRQFAQLGADGLVIGVLDKDGALDLVKMQELISVSGGKRIALHRAFDVCNNPKKCLEDAISLGIQTILTSGQAQNCLDGADCLEALIQQAGDRIEIMVGAGVNANVIQKLQPRLHARAYHMSGKMTLDSGMEYRAKRVSMGLPSLSEFEIWRTDEEKIRAAKLAIEQT